MFKRIVVSGLLIGLAACVSEPRHREGRRFGQGGPSPSEMGRGHGVFISPSGEPFRGGDGLRAWFAQADADNDGAITVGEFQADALRFFHVLDANHDGTVDGFEISAYEQAIAPEIAVLEFDRPGFRPGEDVPHGASRNGREGSSRLGPPGGGARGGDGAGRSGGRFALIDEPEPVANADENIDGKVSLEEWKHATSRRFVTLDKARTGRLTLDRLDGRPHPKP